MSKALAYNLIKPEIKDNYEFLTIDVIKEAIDGLHANGEKILAIIPMQFNVTTGELKEALAITEVEF